MLQNCVIVSHLHMKQELDAMSWSKRIAALRESCGSDGKPISRTQLSRMIGCHRNSVWLWEHGLSVPTIAAHMMRITEIEQHIADRDEERHVQR